ncbi:MAG: terpene cyclase/mutase family protein [Planctomycetes bacterium]|nr:terpene cyclase/mutase family protein [Planctomycetota bacterium]
MMDERFEQCEAALDEAIAEAQPSELHESLTNLVRRAPWWMISFLVHVIALLVLCAWPMPLSAKEQIIGSVVVELVKEPQVEKWEDLKKPEREFEEERVEDTSLPIKDIPIAPELPSEREGSDGGTDGGPRLDLDDDLPPNPVDDLRPVTSLDPPSDTPTFALDTLTSPRKRTPGIYSGRPGRSGRFGPGKGGGGWTEKAQSCVDAGLYWLKRAQKPDGHWSCREWDGAGDFDTGMTGLALLCFLGAGYTHVKGPYQDTVRRGLEWLKNNQKDNGSFGWKTFYEQGIATMAVSEAYGMTQSPAVGRMAQNAVDYICLVQPEHGGFRYAGAVDKEGGDMSVTGWQIMAIKSAICSELRVPQQAVERSRVFLKNTLRDYGGSAYTVGTPAATPAMTAIGMLCRQFLGGDYDADILAAANTLIAHERQRQGARGGDNGVKDTLVNDLYYTYYSVLAMFQMGPQSEFWREWNKMFRDPLVKLQFKEDRPDTRGRFIRGSWDPTMTMWGSQGGRVFSTTMAILCLEVYYRYLPVYRT